MGWRKEDFRDVNKTVFLSGSSVDPQFRSFLEGAVLQAQKRAVQNVEKAKVGKPAENQFGIKKYQNSRLEPAASD